MNYSIIENIWKTKSYFNLLIFVLFMLITITSILQYNVIPTLKKMAYNNILAEAKKVSYYMSDFIDYNNQNLENIDKKLEPLIVDFGIDKIHYFDKDGKVIYSTVKEKLGEVNTHSYFLNIISKGKPYYSIKFQGSKSLENEEIKRSVIEIYIPIMEGNSFLGAFELYYDISENVEQFNGYSNLILKINIILVLVLFLLFFILLYLISEKSLKEKELISKDYLTGLFNRRYFYKTIDNLILLSKREKKSISICMIDIDDFKLINDKYGHDMGDDVLKEFSLEMGSLIRESDILVRFGGEEFLLFLPNTDIDNAEILTKKICKHFECLDNKINFTVSIGISEHKYTQIIDDTIKEADINLYLAKSEGKNRVVKSKL